MKKLKYLINDVRLATDNLDTNGIKDREIVQYFNDGVKLIQLLIFKHQPLCRHFIKESSDYGPIAKGVAITLPSDCYADNGLSTVLCKSGSDWYPINPIFEEELGRSGYKVKGKTVVFNFDVTEGVKIEYVRRLPRFDIRWGKVASVVGSVIALTEATDADLSLINDTISIVDANGVVIQSDILVTTYNLPTNLTTSTPPSGTVASGHYVVSGGHSTTICDLPEECETFLMDYVKQRVFTRNNYTDAQKQGIFTENQRAALVELFSNNTKEITSPPITDTDYLWV